GHGLRRHVRSRDLFRAQLVAAPDGRGAPRLRRAISDGLLRDFVRRRAARTRRPCKPRRTRRQWGGSEPMVPRIVPNPALLSIERIIEAGLCIGCGLCRSIAPSSIAMEMSPEGAELPVLRQPLSDRELSSVNQVCPGLRVEGR